MMMTPELELYHAIANAIKVANRHNAPQIAARLHLELIHIERQRPGTYDAWVKSPDGEAKLVA